jgi:3D (Asp-Asp-Asp) domain-containing protein
VKSILEAAGVAVAMPSGMLLALAVTSAITALPAEAAPSAAYCRQMKLTGYVRTDFSSRTYDGTSIYTREAIAAASWEIPINSIVHVKDVGSFRVADRGRLGSDGWIDIAVWTRPEAYALTGTRTVCVQLPGEVR